MSLDKGLSDGVLLNKAGIKKVPTIAYATIETNEIRGATQID